MRLVIDMQGAQNQSRFRGIGRYTMSLVSAICRNAKDHEIFLILNAAFPDSIHDVTRNFEKSIPKDHIKVFKTPLQIEESNPSNKGRVEIAKLIREYFLKCLNPDIVFLTSPFEGFGDNSIISVGKFINMTTAITIHDFIPLILKDIYLENKVFKAFYLQRLSELENADLFLPVSSSSNQEAINILGISKSNSCVVSNAVDDTFSTINIESIEQKQFLQNYGINKKMLLYVPGGFDPRKNFENIIKAFALLPKHFINEYQLVIASKIQDHERKFLEAISKKAGLDQKKLILTGYISDIDLKKFYSLCELFIFPSLHEGFGLPLLEAMACGAAVIGSNTTSIPEVIGLDRALFDPYDIDSISSKILEVLSNKDFTLELKKHSLEQAKKFSWDNSAIIAIKFFEQILNSKEDPSTNNEPIDCNLDFLIKNISGIIFRNPELNNELIEISEIIEANEIELGQIDGFLKE